MVDKMYLLNNFTMQYWEHTKAHLIQDNEPCLKEHGAVAQYWQAKDALARFEKLKATNTANTTVLQKLSAMVNLNFHTQHEDYHARTTGIVGSPSIYILGGLLASVLAVKVFV